MYKHGFIFPCFALQNKPVIQALWWVMNSLTVVTKHLTWLNSLHQDLTQLLACLGKLINFFFSNYTTVEMDLNSLLMELVFFEVYRKQIDKGAISKNGSLMDMRHDVAEDLQKLPGGGAFLKYPETIRRKQWKKVILTVKKGNETKRIYEKINGVITKYVGCPISFDNLEAELQCVKGETKIISQDAKFKYLRHGLKRLKWKWGVTPGKQENIGLDVNIYIANKKVMRSVRESAWPDFSPPRVVIKVSRESLGSVFKELIQNPLSIPIVVTVLGGILSGIVMLILRAHFSFP